MGLQKVTSGYRGLQGATRGYRGLQKVTSGYGGYRRLQGVTRGCCSPPLFFLLSPASALTFAE